MQNILTIDWEDWYQIALYKKHLKLTEWKEQPGRLRENTFKILKILERTKSKATFFIVAYNAQREPELINDIVAQGHELALHGYYHDSVNHQTKAQFKAEIFSAKKMLEDISQRKIIGFRAPNWSINRTSLWALDIIKEAGFLYDSSLSRTNFLNMKNNLPVDLLEIPREGLNFIKFHFPVAGGFFLRAYPYMVTREYISFKNRKNKPVMVYFHPWEIDEKMPKKKLNLTDTIIRDFNLGSQERKVEALLRDFKFDSIRNRYF